MLLFERTNKSVRSTPFGEKVIRKARKVLDEIQDIRTLCGLCRTAIRKQSLARGAAILLLYDRLAGPGRPSADQT